LKAGLIRPRDGATLASGLDVGDLGELAELIRATAVFPWVSQSDGVCGGCRHRGVSEHKDEHTWLAMSEVDCADG
jgi:hypothetical protein